MVVLSRGNRLTMDSLPHNLETDPLLHNGHLTPASSSLVALQRAAVEKALAEFNGHRTRAAESLGISVRTLQRKLKAWGMENAEKESQVPVPTH
jgi:DNA-binding NtrC family response regulator